MTESRFPPTSNEARVSRVLLEKKRRGTKRAALYAAYERAAQDDEFMARMNSVTRSFATAEVDGL
jgi:hypothetical protein